MLEVHATAVRNTMKYAAARSHPQSTSTIQLELGDAIIGEAVARAVTQNGAGFRIQPRNTAGRAAGPNHSPFAFEDAADLVAIQPLAFGPGAPSWFTVRADKHPIQAEVGTHPEVVLAVAPDGPNRVARKAFGCCPALPLLVTKPARNAIAEQSDPDGAFTIDENAAGGVGGKPLRLSDVPLLAAGVDGHTKIGGDKQLAVAA